MRQNWLSNRIFKSFDDIVDQLLLRLEHAHRSAVERLGGRPRGERRQFAQRRMSVDVGDRCRVSASAAALGAREGEDSCALPFIKTRHQHDLAIGELERIMIDLKHALTLGRRGLESFCFSPEYQHQ
jgi:hypothetical protein